MNTRLQQFLTMENISPAKFSEILGIQRSGISHLLSGRNKPSYDFIQKMMVAFPELNYEWLILGKGKPYKDKSEPSTSHSEPSLFSEQEKITAMKQASEPSENAKIERISGVDVQIQPSDNKTTMHIETIPISQPSQMVGEKKETPVELTSDIRNPESPDKGLRSEKERRIERITIYYTDGTYEDR
ncbi:MAG: helix-turn-helix transcriptional regulator [Bacteroidales bacterium]|nr:helix-turn-helix transcriptional regulator [Candidatus Cacconaster merdequi]